MRPRLDAPSAFPPVLVSSARHRRAGVVAYDRAARTLYGRPLALSGNEVSVRLLVDRGQLEVFADSRKFSPAYNVNFDSAAVSQGIRLFATGGQVRLKNATFTRLSTSWGTDQSTLESTLAGLWHAAGGAWTDTSGGKRAQTTGDAFYLSASSASDGVYQGDVRLDTAQAAGLTFRAGSEGAGYTANIDSSGVVKLWRPGRDIATYATPIAKGSGYRPEPEHRPSRFHRLSLGALDSAERHVDQTEGSRIRVWLGDGADPLIDATDTAYASGRLGVNAYAGNVIAQNLKLG
jgi:fructan beta-fructosidase